MISHETDQALARARGTLDRVRLQSFDMPATTRRSRPRRSVAKRAAAIGAANVIILLAAAIIGLAIMPLGIFGALAVVLVMMAVTLAIAFAPGPRPVTHEKLVKSDLKALPMQTTRWLDAQRPALPAPAVQVADRIGLRLDTLGKQLQALDDGAPVGADIRRLVAEQLPDFIRDYQRVPVELRGAERNGKTPDRQLVEGLELIEREIGQMSEELARGDLDSLETRGRFLEMKYKDGDAT
ncbi:hypothetical protein [Sphingomonas jeddahensis]|uniref:5-bromo-4-chloroindolyl phosphate hydrolysis protein n=1 Tax=Sphingomonas jeddahensis TaxID=1915074 RepID=A0A1V2ES89_9SPHN|nr:hypothetical protein [Sphingomonas jeddahensis]ONF95450.1 hypothetical protein SPHI_23490 [Sphingomonas jeddahensis]